MKNSKTVLKDKKGAYEECLKVRMRNIFFEVGYKKKLISNMFLAGCVFILLGLVAFFSTRPPVIQNFAATEDGRYVPITPLNEPIKNFETLLNFAEKGATRPLTYNFKFWKAQLNSNRPLFTKDGFKGYLKELEDSGNVKLVVDNELFQTATIKRVPVLVDEGIHPMKNVYRWKMEIPILFELEGRKSRKNLDALVSLEIQRVPQVDNPKGLGISYFGVKLLSK